MEHLVPGPLESLPIFSHGALGLAAIDPATGRLLDLDRRAAAILGHPRDVLIGLELAALVDVTDAPRTRDLLAGAGAGALALRVAATRDGVRRELRIDLTPVPSGDRTVAVAMVQDVSERVRAERELQRNRHLLAESQRIAQIGSYALDYTTGAVAWTEQMYRLYEVGAEFQPSLSSVVDLMHPEDRARVAVPPEGALAVSRAGFRFRVPTATGVRVLEGFGEAATGDQGEPLLIGTVRDVTREVEAASVLEASEARFRGVFEHAIDGIVLAQLDGTILDANPAFVAILGCAAAEQVIGSELRTWFADRAAAERLALRDACPGRPVEVVLRRLDGARANVCLDGLVIDQPDGRHFLGFVRDLTTEQERTAREREAIEASQAKTAFLAGMSHELRTPLNAVLGLSEALLEGTFGTLVASQVRALETVHASGQHLLALINDVLDIARVETGQLPIETESVPLRDPIDESLALVHGEAERKRQRLRALVEEELPRLELDKRRIKQVLINLLGNAVKFSPPGAAITLTARRLPPGDRVELVVRDNGPGVPVADRERIFEPFVTLDRSAAREQGGAGLGLTMVKRIVELHGGTVHVEAPAGGGSAFIVELPAPPMPIQDGGAPDAPWPFARAGAGEVAPVVLLAEDSEANVLTVQGYLERHGYVVRVVRDGGAAVEAAAAPDVAAILMDVRLPVLDGLEAMRRIRAAEHGAPRPIVALTAYAMPADEQRCFAAGATSFLAKPVRLRQLVERLDVLLRIRK